jgi:hypothetical protein
VLKFKYLTRYLTYEILLKTVRKPLNCSIKSLLGPTRSDEAFGRKLRSNAEVPRDGARTFPPNHPASVSSDRLVPKSKVVEFIKYYQLVKFRG